VAGPRGDAARGARPFELGADAAVVGLGRPAAVSGAPREPSGRFQLETVQARQLARFFRGAAPAPRRSAAIPRRRNRQPRHLVQGTTPPRRAVHTTRGTGRFGTRYESGDARSRMSDPPPPLVEALAACRQSRKAAQPKVIVIVGRVVHTTSEPISSNWCHAHVSASQPLACE
jgi:hypothetical protein